MSALTVDASSNPHVSSMPVVTPAAAANGHAPGSGSAPHLVKYVLHKGPNNTFLAKPALPSSPVVTIKESHSTASTNITGIDLPKKRILLQFKYHPTLNKGI